MLRTALAALAALAFGLPAASAEELKGTLKKVNTTANSLTVTVDGKDRTLPVSKDASFVTVSTEKKGKKGKPMEKLTPIDGGLGALKEGSPVTVLTEKVDDAKETVTSVKVGNSTAPAKKKAKKAKKPKTVAEKLQPISTEDKASKKADKKKSKKADKKKAKKAAKKKSKRAGKNKKKGKNKKGKKGKKTNKDI